MREIVGKALAEFLVGVDDLDQCQHAVTREKAIRDGMAQTGATREVVIEALDAMTATDQEAVLDLMYGAPTTLVDAQEEKLVQLHNPHYGLALHIAEGDNRDLEIRMGNNRHLVYAVNWEDAGSGGQQECQAVAEAVYRATLVRVIPDRDHHVQLNATDLRDLVAFLKRPGGSWSADRLTVEACGGGVLVRTRPYTYQSAATTEQRRIFESNR